MNLNTEFALTHATSMLVAAGVPEKNAEKTSPTKENIKNSISLFVFVLVL